MTLKDLGRLYAEFEAASALLAGQPHSAGKLYAGFTVKFSALPTGGTHFAETAEK